METKVQLQTTVSSLNVIFGLSRTVAYMNRLKFEKLSLSYCRFKRSMDTYFQSSTSVFLSAVVLYFIGR